MKEVTGMISISIGQINGGYMVYGTKMVGTEYVTRPFEFFKTIKGANNYAIKYIERQSAFYRKRGR